MRRASLGAAFALLLFLPLAALLPGFAASPAQAATKIHRVDQRRAASHHNGPAVVPAYDSLQTPLPGNQESWCYEGCSTAELGQQIELSQPGALATVVVTMSSWQCESGAWPTANNGVNTDTQYCYTPDFGTAAASFTEPITLNIYNVGPGNTLGGLVATTTQTFTIYDRPTSDLNGTHCGGDATAWYQASSGDCFHGYAQNITFTGLSGADLPQKLIYGIAYNTSGFGASPYGYSNPCNSADNGCGYDSLNVALNSNESVHTPGGNPEPLPPSVGSDPGPAGTTWLSSTYAGFYCDDGGLNNTDVGTFREDSSGRVGPDGCGNEPPANNFDESPAGYDPSVEFNVAPTSEVELYVTPATDGGNDMGGTNNCTLPSQPCATIAHALEEEALLAPGSVGSVINLSSGTFDSPSDAMFSALTAANNNVTITGQGKKTVVQPMSCSSLATVSGGPDNNDTAMVVFNTGEDGITVENVDLNGSEVTNCSHYTAGVIDTSGTTGDAIEGNLVQSGATYGILTDDGANSTIISNDLIPVLCTGTVTGPNTGLDQGWTSPANLKVNKIPACAQFKESSHPAFSGIFINGTSYCAKASATAKTVVITGEGPGCAQVVNSSGVEIPKGATVVYNTSVAPFTEWGIACNSPLQASDPTTDCALSDNNVTAGGTVYGDYGAACGGFPPVGIVVTGSASANVDSNSVSDVTDSISECPQQGETTNDGVGIGLLPDSVDAESAGDTVVGVNELNNPTTGDGNKLSGNDNGIVVSGGAKATPQGTYQINGNTVSSAKQSGISLTALGEGTGTLANPNGFEANAVSGVTLGSGIVLEGVQGQTVGGPLSSLGNTSNGNGVGMVLVPCYGLGTDLPGPLVVDPSGNGICESLGSATAFSLASTGNTVQNNTLNNNSLYGLLKAGAFQPEEIYAPTCVQPTGIPPAPLLLLPPDLGGTGNQGCQPPPGAPVFNLQSSGNTFNGNTWTGNGAAAPLVNGANVMDGTGWGGGCGSKPGACPAPTVASSLVYEGPNTTFPSTSNTSPFTLGVCNTSTSAVPLEAGSEITFYDEQPGLSGTFFVTATTVLEPNTASCVTTPWGFSTISLQALNPEKIGTDSSPTGQPYVLGTGAKLTINLNGATAFAAQDTYGAGAKANSCTPDGAPVLAPPNIFGTTNGVGHPSSTTLDEGTGGVNATYDAC